MSDYPEATWWTGSDPGDGLNPDPEPIARCARCDGEGKYEIGGADIESDPPMEMTCDVCGGTGQASLTEDA